MTNLKWLFYSSLSRLVVFKFVNRVKMRMKPVLTKMKMTKMDFLYPMAISLMTKAMLMVKMTSWNRMAKRSLR